MPKKKKATRKNAYRARDKAGGIDRREIYIDDTTYELLLDLLNTSGYCITNKNEVKQGISGVLLHLVNQASQKCNKGKIADMKSHQQKVLLARIANNILNGDKDEYYYDDIVTMWKQYTVGKKALKGLSSKKEIKQRIHEIIDNYLEKDLPYK